MAHAPKNTAQVIVAVHGMGNQTRNATIQGVARQIGSGELKPYNVPTGFFAGPEEGKVKVSVLDPSQMGDDGKGCYGFAEIFWADLPQKAVAQGQTIEEVQLWAGSIVEKLKRRGVASGKVQEQDADRVGRVLGTMVETINVLESLLFVLRKLGIFDFELKRTLVESLGDVQLVGDFEDYRETILQTFEDGMQAVQRQCPDAEITIVAHSEGTPVSVLGLLRALKQQAEWRATRGEAAEPGPHKWVEQVRSYVTLGSPIDKHIIFWPELFAPFLPVPETGQRRVAAKNQGKLNVDMNLPRATLMLEELEARKTDDATRFAPLGEGEKDRRIRWLNYYDFADPVGFELDTARAYLRDTGWDQWFDFPRRHDFGFSRYALPGAVFDLAFTWHHYVRRSRASRKVQDLWESTRVEMGKIADALQEPHVAPKEEPPPYGFIR